MTKYLVTGGAGFIGSNIVRKLVQQNKKVCIFVEKNSNLWRLQNIISFIEIVEIDITNEQQVFLEIKKIKPNIIFHLAAVGIKPFKIFQKKLFDVNFYGTINLLNACKEIDLECFVNTGSAVEYGRTDLELTEDLPVAPTEDYGISKAAGSLYCLKEATINNLPIYTARLFCAYGDYEEPHRLIPSILINGLKNQTINLSSPHFVRDFIYIEDIVNFYLTLAHKKPNKNFIFNVGTGIQYSIENIVTEAQKHFDYKLKIQWNETTPRNWEFKNWKASIDLSKKILDWKPEYSLNDGIKKSFKWFNKNLNLYDNPNIQLNKNNSRISK
jgi:nucleoside-diphosphate-sugar epimerase